MASYRRFGESGTYRSKPSVGAGATTTGYGKNTSIGSNLPSLRIGYAGTSSNRTIANKERPVGFGGTAAAKKDEKMSYKYSNRCIRGLSSENTPKPIESTMPRYGAGTYPGSTVLSRSYGNDNRIEKREKIEHTPPPPPTSYRSLRSGSSGRPSREPSPEVGVGKLNNFRTFSRGQSYGGRSYTPCNTPDSSSIQITKYTTTTTTPSSLNSRFPSRASSERVSSSTSYSSSDKYRASSKPNTNVGNNNKSEEDGKEPSSASTLPLEEGEELSKDKIQETDSTILTMVTRGTSPTPAASSSFLRSRRADNAVSSQREMVKPREKVETKDQEIQCNRNEEISRFSRLAATGRISGAPWSSYFDKFGAATSVPTSGSALYTSRIGGGYGYSSRSMNNKVQSNSSQEAVRGKSFSSQDTKVQQTELQFTNNNSHDHSNESSQDVDQNNFCKREEPQGETKQRSSTPSRSGERKSIPRLSGNNSSPRGERRGSTPKSDTGSSSKIDDSVGNSSSSNNRGEVTQKRDQNAPRRESTQSAALQNRSTILRSRSNSSKNLSRQNSQQESSESSAAVNVPIGKSKSSSASSVTSQSAKIKTSSPLPPPLLTSTTVASSGKSSDGNSSSAAISSSSSGNLGQVGVGSSGGKPPVPKNEFIMNSVNNSTCGKYVNKDFRKSTLNMENSGGMGGGNGGGSSRSKTERKNKSYRSMSVSSQDSEPNSESSQVKMSRSKLNMFSSGSNRLEKSRSGSKSPSKSKRRTAPATSITTTSSGSSSSESSGEEQDGTFESRRRDRRRRASSSPQKGKISAGSSRTSILASSADENSLTTDKPPRPPSSPRSKNDQQSRKTEEAKSFLMRALAPVTNLFKKQQEGDSSRSGSWLDSNEESEMTKKSSGALSRSVTQSLSKSLSFTNSEKNTEKRRNNTRVQRQSSGERPWWLDPNPDNVPEGVERMDMTDDVSQETNVSMVLPDDGKFKFKVWSQDSENNEGSQNTSPISKRSSSSRNVWSSGDNRNRIKHQQSGERAWWMSDDPENVPEGVEVIVVSSHNPSQNTENSETFDETFPRTIGKLRHIDSGEKPWWMESRTDVRDEIRQRQTSNSNSDSEDSYEKIEIGLVAENRINTETKSISRFPIEFPPPPVDEPLGDRASPEGIENPPAPPDDYGGRSSPYDNVRPSTRKSVRRKRPANLPLFIGNHIDIDDFLGKTVPSFPMMDRDRKNPAPEYDSDSECEEIDPSQVIVHDSTGQTPIIQRRNREPERFQPDGYIPLDDTALQLYKDGDYGAYLDLEASISEQQEEFEGFQTCRKNTIVLRTQLSVRVHTIIEKLLNSEGRELRRALFSLKQIFQEDKDLVHEFVQNDGLACLIKVGSEADQNYQNYILRALGQVMLYVDGMNGVMEHGQTVQWLYTLIASRFRLVVKTALKLLLVFVEYVETNSLLLVRAVRAVDTSRGMIPWTNVMRLLKDYDAADTELLIYATTLVNKCLNGIPDQDTYYDQVDCLEEQGMEGIIQRYMSKQGTELDLLRQFQIYEAVLHHEDGNDRGSPIKQLDDNIRKTLRNRKSLVDSHERRKSRRHSTGTSPLSMTLNARLSPRLNHSIGLNSLNNTLNSTLSATGDVDDDDDDESSSSQSSQGHLGEVQINGCNYKENKVDVGVTPALRRRRERAERQRSFIREQQEATANLKTSIGLTEHEQEGSFGTNGLRYTNGSSQYERNTDSPSNKLSKTNSRKDLTPLMNVANKLDSEEKKPWYGKSPDEGVECDEGNHTDEDEDRRVVLQLKREGTVKDLTQKLAAQNLIPSSPIEEKVSRIGDMSGLISKAKEGLAKSKSKADVLKSPTSENLPKIQEIKKSENELHWEELVKKLQRPLALCDLDFTDLNSDDEFDILSPVNVTNGIPPPPPPMAPPPGGMVRAPPPPPPGGQIPPPLPQGSPLSPFAVNLKSTRSSATPNDANTPKSPPPILAKKSKKTVKLFWKEVRDDPIILSRLDKNKMIWDELSPVPVDTQKLEHLFESRAKDLITKEKQQEMNKNKEIIVLDHKRSNAINIGMTKLPPPRSIKTAILKMDATIMNREGIEKLLTMLPTEEERSRIQEAQAANPDLPLGSAEQFLLTLASISELPARLKLWAFKLDFENSEKEIADPLMDLKQGMETLRVNKTFRGILSTLLSIGIFLNGNEVKGFQLEYLAKVPEVKDTVHKHSLLHHLCHMVMEKFPDSTDLYSEIGAVTRASKIDFDELASNISKLENECKASWDHLKLIAKHDGSTMMKVKMSDFLADCAERIIVLGIVHRRIINRFHKFLIWLGIPLHRVQDTKPNEFCRIVSEFALEYRTTRERVIQQLEKKANHRERNKTRGKMITEVGKFRTKEDRADAELRQLLGSDISDVESIHGTLPWRRQRKDGRTSLGPLIRHESTNGNLTDGDDELLESLVKTATKTPATRTTPRERKRTRHADLKRSRTRENNTTPDGYQP